MDEFINTIETNRQVFKKKLDIATIVAACILGVGIILLIIGITFSNSICFIIFVLTLIISCLIYGISYATYNKKYLNTFIGDLDKKAIELNYGDNYFYQADGGVGFETMDSSRCINRPDEFYSSKLFASHIEGVSFTSSNYLFKYYHYRTDKDGNTERTVNLYRGRFIKFDFPRELNAFLSIMEKHAIDEMIKDPRLGDKLEFEYMEFNKKFKVKTSDELKANYIITPQVQVNLVDFDNAFNSELICVFIDKSVYVFMHEYAEKMTLGIYKKFDQKVFDNYANEFIIPKLVMDALGLDNDKYTNTNL